MQKDSEGYGVNDIKGTTPSLSNKQAKFCQKRSYHIPFLGTFRADFNHAIIEMIPWPQLEGSQS